MIVHKLIKWPVLILVLLLQGCISVNVSLLRPPVPVREIVVEGKGQPKILLLNISGFISERSRGGTILNPEKTPSSVVHVREALLKAGQDDEIAGVIININSPGGTVTASDIIYHEIVNFKQNHQVPVYACITGLGTSGGYYVAAATDKITAHPAAITGSIGVIALKFNVKALLDKIGVENETVKSGDKKDLFSPFRPSTPEERQIMQDIINHLHERFVNAISDQRKDVITKEQIGKLADGRIYTAAQALELKLIDHIEYLDDTINRMKKSLDIEEARIITYSRAGDYSGTIYSANTSNKSSVLDLLSGQASGISPLSGVELLYLWNP